ncbi:hypothetical protein, partial [Leisingera sp. JC1]|uniref:hypothetical protein n=1 Tax=Leisingera sp. JC1 TaxID=1855282 RepID=UPI001C3028E6
MAGRQKAGKQRSCSVTVDLVCPANRYIKSGTNQAAGHANRSNQRCLAAAAEKIKRLRQLKSRYKNRICRPKGPFQAALRANMLRSRSIARDPGRT